MMIFSEKIPQKIFFFLCCVLLLSCEKENPSPDKDILKDIKPKTGSVTFYMKHFTNIADTLEVYFNDKLMGQASRWPSNERYFSYLDSTKVELINPDDKKVYFSEYIKLYDNFFKSFGHNHLIFYEKEGQVQLKSSNYQIPDENKNLGYSKISFINLTGHEKIHIHSKERTLSSVADFSTSRDGFFDLHDDRNKEILVKDDEGNILMTLPEFEIGIGGIYTLLFKKSGNEYAVEYICHKKANQRYAFINFVNSTWYPDPIVVTNTQNFKWTFDGPGTTGYTRFFYPIITNHTHNFTGGFVYFHHGSTYSDVYFREHSEEMYATIILRGYSESSSMLSSVFDSLHDKDEMYAVVRPFSQFRVYETQEEYDNDGSYKTNHNIYIHNLSPQTAIKCIAPFSPREEEFKQVDLGKKIINIKSTELGIDHDMEVEITGRHIYYIFIEGYLIKETNELVYEVKIKGDNFDPEFILK